MEDFFVSLNKTTVRTKIQKPVSALPKVWIGFLFAAAFLVVEIREGPTYSLEEFSPTLIVIGLFGAGYWMFCVHRFHKILGELDSSYGISPGAAVGYHFIPFFNFYWVFKWPSEFSKFINSRKNIKMIPGGLLGFLLLISLLINGYVNQTAGLAFIFGLSLYFKNRLSKQIEASQNGAKESRVYDCDIPRNMTWNENSSQAGLVTFYCPDCKNENILDLRSFHTDLSPGSEELTLCQDKLYFVKGTKRFLSALLGFFAALFTWGLISAIFQIEFFGVLFAICIVIAWTIYEKIFEGLVKQKIPIWKYSCRNCHKDIYLSSDGKKVLIGRGKEKKTESPRETPTAVAMSVQKEKISFFEEGPEESIEPHVEESKLENNAPYETSSRTKTLFNPNKDLIQGSTFAERYRIIEELGKGGRGRVYKAYDLDLEEKVALKLINPEISADEKTISRFRRELKIARKISHKNVCRVFDLGKEGDKYYITMEYVSGEDLKSTLRRIGPLSAGKATSIANQICQGLAEAHRLGIIHRDLKPQNIMIDRNGNVRIMDFGIARSEKAEGLTEDGVVIGTPEYMSPEQVEGNPVDERSDVYSLGIILYEMMTGRVPFDGMTPMSVASKHLTKKPREPREINAQIPRELNEVIMRCMEKERRNRYQNIEELLSNLIEIEKRMPSTDVIKPAGKPFTSKEITLSFKLKKILIPASLVLAAIVVGIIGWQLIQSRKPGKALPSSIHSKEDILNAAQMYLTNKDYSGALESYKKILELDPKNFEAQLGTAFVLKERGKVDNSIKEFEKAIDLDDTDPRPYVQLANIFEEREEHEKALYYYEKYLNYAPDSSDFDEISKKKIMLEAEIELAQRMEKSAVESGKKRSGIEEVSIREKLNNGAETSQKEESIESIEMMEDAVKVEKKHRPTHQYLEDLKKEQDKLAAKEEIENRIQLAQSAYQKGNYQECLDQSKAALNLDSDNTEAKKYLDLATMKIIPGQIANLVDLYTQSVSDNTLKNFYRNNCSGTLYQKISKDVELITNQYDNFKSRASDMTLRFKENDQIEVRFSNITTGVSKKDKSRQVIFEGIYVWDLEKQADTWKIIDIHVDVSKKRGVTVCLP